MIHRTPLQVVWDLSMVLTAVLSVWRGRWPERTVAFGMIVSSIATAALQNTHDWSAPQWADLGDDVLYLLLLLWVALRSDRRWPLFAAAFQLVLVCVYGAELADVRIGARAPFLAGAIWSFLILIAVLVGLWLEGGGKRPSEPSPWTGSSST